MAIATFKRFSESGKTALVLVKANKFQLTKICAYLPADACEDMKENDTFEIPDGYKLVPMVSEDGEARTTKDGIQLHSLEW